MNESDWRSQFKPMSEFVFDKAIGELSIFWTLLSDEDREFIRGIKARSLSSLTGVVDLAAGATEESARQMEAIVERGKERLVELSDDEFRPVLLEMIKRRVSWVRKLLPRPSERWPLDWDLDKDAVWGWLSEGDRRFMEGVYARHFTTDRSPGEAPSTSEIERMVNLVDGLCRRQRSSVT